MSALPIPDHNALLSSQRLMQQIQQQIADRGGWISFADYMQAALYTPHLGYYSGHSYKFGSSGDFVTAPELTPLFAATLAADIAPLLPLSGNTVIEFGAGSGRLAADLLKALAQQQALPTHYYIVEISADLAARQRDYLMQECPALLSRVVWLSALPDQIEAVVIGNEVLDAIPCELVYWDPTQQPWQRGVAWSEDGFVWADRPIQDPRLQAAVAMLEPGPDYLSEVQLAAAGFMHTLAERLQRGAILLFDYGFPRDEYYHPQRRQGTLMCHYRHHAHADPFLWPGLQDITTHIDFTTVAEIGLQHGLDLQGYTTQAQYLINAGILDQLAQFNPEDITHYLPHANAVQKLLSTAEMGELFKVIGFSRGLPLEWQGFLRGDRCRYL